MSKDSWKDYSKVEDKESDGHGYLPASSMPDIPPTFRNFNGNQPPPYFNQPVYQHHDNFPNYINRGFPPPNIVPGNVSGGIPGHISHFPGNIMPLNHQVSPVTIPPPSQSSSTIDLHDNSPPSQPPSKKRNTKTQVPNTTPRRRALTACNTCRTKKVKCDNMRPRCGSCVKNGIETCEYVNEDQIKDIANYDYMSVNILQKLDNIIGDIKVIKETNPCTPCTANQHHLQINQPLVIHAAGSPMWDMSFTTILKWEFFTSKVPGLLNNYSEMERQLLKSYSETLPPVISKVASIEERFSSLKLIEAVFFNSLGQCINSFFVNCHTKVPVLDVLEFIESIELYKLFHKFIPNFSLIELAEDYESTKLQNKEIGDLYLKLIPHIDDLPFRRVAYFNLCKMIPLIPLICALGILSSPVQLENFSKYQTSLEERSDLTTSCLTEESIKLIPEPVPKERLSISSWLITYSKTLINFWPEIYKPFTLNSVIYHLFLSQFGLYVLKPMAAFQDINLACQHMMHYLNRKRDLYQKIIYKDENQKRTVERLFWSCLKLECELKTELSPKVSVSGITNVEPPCPFPSVPVSIIDESINHSKECLQIANNLDDQYTWYYFLTEIAVRKLDNDLCNEFYAVDTISINLWDQKPFYEKGFWIAFIRFLNQYNGIINSLSPKIRNFVLKEFDIERIFKSVSQAFERRKAKQIPDDDLTHDLSDFLIDNDLLIQSQSESIMYIKTRILASKLLLFRPMIYLILTDKIPIQDLIQGAFSVYNESQNISNDLEVASTSLSDLSSTENDIAMDYDKILEAPLYYQRRNADEDFSHYFIEVGKSESFFKNELLPEAKKQIIKLFFLHLKSVPKLNIPKLGGHRHPGQWYYLRNLLTGNFYMFLLFKKLQDLLLGLKVDPDLQQMIFSNPMMASSGNLSDILDNLLPKKTLIFTLQHSLLVYDYWKDEAPDCKIYADIVSQCLKTLNEN